MSDTAGDFSGDTIGFSVDPSIREHFPRVPVSQSVSVSAETEVHIDNLGHPFVVVRDKAGWTRIDFGELLRDHVRLSQALRGDMVEIVPDIASRAMKLDRNEAEILACVSRLQSEVERLTRVVERYASHDSGCSAQSYKDRCDCGLLSALSQEAGQ